MERIPAQTTKQAKAAYKARNNAVLSDSARRAIERDSLLHRRAWGVREREKSRLVAAQKKAEKEQRERAESANAAYLATQRRRDKFGYKSSQYHLGAFFTKASNLSTARATDATLAPADECTADLFDEDIDEDAILSALWTPVERTGSTRDHTQGRCSFGRAVGKSFTSDEDSRMIEDHGQQLDWLDFDSSTQIARELDASDTQPDCTEFPDSPLREPSLDSTEYSLGLTSQDLENLDTIIADSPAIREQHDRQAMPPPMLTNLKAHTPKATSLHDQHHRYQRGQQKQQPSLQIEQAHSFVQDFSSTQLERYVDDDLMLTQA